MIRITAVILAMLSLAFSPIALSVPEIDERIEQWQPTPRERAWERIGWARDIRDAMRLAKTNDRPVFLFTHDGRLGIGRC